MISSTTARFWKSFDELPSDIQKRARVSFQQFLDNPRHPGLQFKLVRQGKRVFSARISDDFRALCVQHGDKYIWFWIGPHDEYERILQTL